MLLSSLFIVTCIFGYGSPFFVRLIGLTEWEIYESGILAKLGIASLLIGMIIGLFAPWYLEIEQPYYYAFILLGGAIFFSSGVGHLLSLKWGTLGFALGLLGFSGIMHYIGIRPMALIALCEASILSALSLGSSYSSSGSRREAGRLISFVVTVISALLTLLDFINIFFGKLIK